MIDITSFRTDGLGDTTYLVRHDGQAILVDPQRDIERFLERLDDADLRFVLETHLHNDYVSGGLSAARATGAELVMPAAAAPVFRHTPAYHREDLESGGLVIRPLHTPGHTPEHTSYLLVVDGKQRAVFSGGSLLVGSAGRSDLLGMARAESLARLQYRSVRTLMNLEDQTSLFPTHGAGSFCTVSSAGGTSSTIGHERQTNPVVGHDDEESFVAAHLSGLQPYPSYYARMSPINLAGPPPMPTDTVPRIGAAEVPADSEVVDVRQPGVFAAGHLPGAVNIPLSDQLGTWFGWLIPAETRVHLVVANEAQLQEALLQLARIGVDDVAGAVVDPGPEAVVASPTARRADIPPGGQILDVRSPGERDSGAPAGTHHRYLPDLRHGPPDALDPTRPVWVMCASGFRAAIGASLLRRRGIDAIPVLDADITDLARSPGDP